MTASRIPMVEITVTGATYADMKADALAAAAGVLSTPDVTLESVSTIEPVEVIVTQTGDGRTVNNHVTAWHATFYIRQAPSADS